MLIQNELLQFPKMLCHRRDDHPLYPLFMEYFLPPSVDHFALLSIFLRNDNLTFYDTYR